MSEWHPSYPTLAGLRADLPRLDAYDQARTTPSRASTNLLVRYKLDYRVL